MNRAEELLRSGQVDGAVRSTHTPAELAQAVALAGPVPRYIPPYLRGTEGRMQVDVVENPRSQNETRPPVAGEVVQDNPADHRIVVTGNPIPGVALPQEVGPLPVRGELRNAIPGVRVPNPELLRATAIDVPLGGQMIPRVVDFELDEAEGSAPPPVAIVHTTPKEEHPWLRRAFEASLGMVSPLTLGLAAAASFQAFVRGIRPPMWKGKLLLMWLAAVINVLLIFRRKFRVGGLRFPDVEARIHADCIAIGADPELVTYLMGSSMFGARDARRAAELGRKAWQWMARYRKNWSNVVRVSHQARAVTLALSTPYVDQAVLGHWSLASSLEHIWRMHKFVKTGQLEEGADIPMD